MTSDGRKSDGWGRPRVAETLLMRHLRLESLGSLRGLLTIAIFLASQLAGTGRIALGAPAHANRGAESGCCCGTLTWIDATNFSSPQSTDEAGCCDESPEREFDGAFDGLRATVAEAARANPETCGCHAQRTPEREPGDVPSANLIATGAERRLEMQAAAQTRVLALGQLDARDLRPANDRAPTRLATRARSRRSAPVCSFAMRGVGAALAFLSTARI